MLKLGIIFLLLISKNCLVNKVIEGKPMVINCRAKLILFNLLLLIKLGTERTIGDNIIKIFHNNSKLLGKVNFIAILWLVIELLWILLTLIIQASYKNKPTKTLSILGVNSKLDFVALFNCFSLLDYLIFYLYKILKMYFVIYWNDIK